MSKQAETMKKDHVAILLEGIRFDFKVFGDDLASVRQRGEANSETLNKLQEDVGVVKAKGDATFEAVGRLQEDMETVKEELHLIRNELKEKVGRDEFMFLESRVAKLEKIMRS